METKKFSLIVKLEISKAIKNKFFLTTLIIALIFTLLSAWYMIDLYYYTQNAMRIHGITGNPMTPAFSLFNHWVSGESTSFGFTLFFTLLPLLAVLPYGWSYFIEYKSGYLKQVVVRSSKLQYFLAKYIATFMAGGLVVCIPLVINLLVVACFIPAITPSPMYALYYSIAHVSMWSQFFYSQPLFFVILYLMLTFIFGGLFATMSLSISFFCKNRIAIILVPFFFPIDPTLQQDLLSL